MDIQKDAVNSSTSEQTLTSPPPSISSNDDSIPILPFDLIPQILCRLPVKYLLQLRCVCKSWNSLISDPNFGKKHLRHSTTRHLHVVHYSGLSCDSVKYTFTSYPLDSVITTPTMSTNVTCLEYHFYDYNGLYIIGSCNGIICLTQLCNESYVLLWNPSIRKFNKLPFFERPQVICQVIKTFGFGYDHVSDNYKVVVVLDCCLDIDNSVHTIEVKVHTLGTNLWKNIDEFPFGGIPVERTGKFVSGTINWLTSNNGSRRRPCVIVSFDLGNESYREILQPDYGEVGVGGRDFLTLSVLRDCLCMIHDHDIWIMKEYGIKESWTKLFTVCNTQDPIKYYTFSKAIHISEDGQLLLDALWEVFYELIVYDSKNDVIKSTQFEKNAVTLACHRSPSEVCVESLISPCF